MNQEIGSKGGKKDRKLTFLNLLRKRKLKNKELEEKNIENKKKIEKEKQVIIPSNDEQIINQPHQRIAKGKRRIEEQEKVTEIVQSEKERIVVLNDKQNVIQNEFINQPQEIITEKVIDRKIETNYEQEEVKSKKISENTTKKIEVNQEPINKKSNDPKEETVITYYHSSPKGKRNEEKVDKVENKKDTLKFEYLEKEIIHILDETIKENKYQLKKLDSEIHTIKKSIDTAEEEDIKELEKEIDIIIEKVKTIQRQLAALEKTFDLNFTTDSLDNYLVYLIDEYKEKIKNKKEFFNILEDNDEYKSILEKIVDLETKKDELLEKVETKKDELEIENDKLSQMNEEVINIENEAKNIKELVDNTTKELEYIKYRVDETVHISEKLKLITKHVDHSIFEVLLLMSILKHNLSIKNNAVCAITAAVTLDLIIKMCTPKTEEVKIKVSDVKNYEDMIKDCIDDTEKLEKTILNNINEIDKIRYIFKNDFKELERLPEYKDVMEKLDSLEIDMKERFDSTKKLTKEIELQLEKNNAKVKKYGDLGAA